MATLLASDGAVAALAAWVPDAEHPSPQGVPGHCRAAADYRVTCILVELGGLVEGYPHYTGGVRKKKSPFLYIGTRTMYVPEVAWPRPCRWGGALRVDQADGHDQGSG